MQYTVKDIVNLEVMNKARVKSAKDQLDHHPVNSISVIEIPVEDFVQKNEFVLSTAVGCGHDPELFLKFVQDIASSHAAGLAVATGRHILEIPENVLQYAEKIGFPIIEVPWEVRFSDIMKEVLGQLQNWQRSILKESEDMQKQLLNLFIRGADLSVFARVVKQKIKRPVIIIDREGIIKGTSPGSDQLVHQWKERSLFLDNSLHWQSLRSSDISLSNVSWSNLGEDLIVRIAVGYSSKIQGYILFSISSDILPETFLDSGNANMLEHAVTVAALWFQRENAIQETEMRLRGDFVWSLAKGEIESWDTILSQAKSLDYNVNKPYVCILGYPENLEYLYQKRKSDQPSFEQWKESIIFNMEDQIIRTSKKMKHQIMTTYQRDHFIIYLETTANQVQDHIHKYLDQVEAVLEKMIPGLVISWGTGDNSAGVNSFHDSFNDARIALNIGRRQKGPGHRSTYTNTGIYRSLQQLANNEEIREIALSTIGNLIEHDNQKGLDLIQTLATYIRHQRNVSQTARSLNLHRQSLLYRLRKIEALTGRSLTNPDDLFLLDLSIKLWTTGMTRD